MADDLRGRLTHLDQTLRTIFDEAGPDLDLDKVNTLEGDSHAKAAEIRKLSAEMDELQDRIEDRDAVAKAAQRDRARREATNPIDFPKDDDDEPDTVESVGAGFVKSKEFAAWTPGTTSKAYEHKVELKTLFQTTAGWPPESVRTGRLVPATGADQPIDALDVFPAGSTTQAAIKYMTETTYTQAAAETAEAGTFPESAFALTEASETIHKIAHFVPVTDEQLEDVPRVRSYLDNRLILGLRQRLNQQVLVGDGTGANLTGVLNRGGIQTQAKATDPVFDAVHKALTKVRVTGQANPTAIIFHPNDWEGVRLTRTADGIYILGAPTEPGPMRLWGVPVVISQEETENTALVGDFAGHSELVSRRGIDVQVSNSHSTYFVEGKQAIRADVRVGLCVYREAAFCTVTGI